MLDRESPFLVRPRLTPAFLAWGVRFWRATSEARYRDGLRATLELARPTTELFDALRADGVAFEMHSDGLLYLVRSADALAGWRAMYDELAQLGFDGQVTELDGAEVRATTWRPDCSRASSGTCGPRRSPRAWRRACAQPARAWRRKPR
jgi:hypothetical protein